MKITPMRRAIGLVLLMIGVVWFMIGVGIFSGSQFTGQAPVAVLGALASFAGVAVLQLNLPWGRRDDTPTPGDPSRQEPKEPSA